MLNLNAKSHQRYRFDRAKACTAFDGHLNVFFSAGVAPSSHIDEAEGRDVG